MTISIHNYKLPVLTHNLYDVTICNEVIRTLVTHTPSMIDSWISDIKRTHRDKSRRLIVGLDVEWLPNLNRFTENPPATLQLCVGGRCLIFQLLYSRTIPQSLVEFLRNVDYEFMGVEIEKDADKLSRFYDLKVVNVVDLRDLAVEKLDREELRRAGLTTLAREVLGKEIEKDKTISWGPWDNEQLTDNQVKYACVDAFLSFEIGRSLRKNTTMTISIYNYKLPVETHNLYDVTICNDVIRTLVTHTPSMVDSWISDVKRTHRDKDHPLIVGLDVEWFPNPNKYTQNPPATLQLCVGGRCLIFQLLYSPYIPKSLVDFLRNVNYEFMGVEIEKDADKLWRFNRLKVVNVLDLCDLAVEKLGRKELGRGRAGLISLAREVLGKEIEKDNRISWGPWDNEELTDNQVKYACVDAFLSFEIGRSLCETRRSFSDETGRSLISSLIGLGIGGSGSGSLTDDTGRSLIGLGIGGSGSGSFHQSSSLTDETGRSLSLTGETGGRSSLLGKSLSLIGIGLGVGVGVGIGASLLMAKANHTDADEDDDAHA